MTTTKILNFEDLCDHKMRLLSYLLDFYQYFSLHRPLTSHLTHTHTHTQKCYIKTHKQEHTLLYSLHNMKSSHISK